MSHYQGTSNECFFRYPIVAENKRHNRFKKKFDRDFSSLKNIIYDAIDDFAIGIFAKKTNCVLCSQFLVMTARNSCCAQCFIGWINEVDHNDASKDEIIKCKKCTRPIKTVLNARELNLFCEIVELDGRKISSSGHFGYPVLGNEAMELLFEDLDSSMS